MRLLHLDSTSSVSFERSEVFVLTRLICRKFDPTAATLVRKDDSTVGIRAAFLECRDDGHQHVIFYAILSEKTLKVCEPSKMKSFIGT